MKLQCNNTGAWKQVLTFQAEYEAEARQLAAEMGMLAENAGGRLAWRILDDYEAVRSYWEGGAIGWKERARG